MISGLIGNYTKTVFHKNASGRVTFLPLVSFCIHLQIMKEITLKVPEKKVAFLLELARQHGFEVAHQDVIPEDHKNEVRNRIKRNHLDSMQDWDEARKTLRSK